MYRQRPSADPSTNTSDAPASPRDGLRTALRSASYAEGAAMLAPPSPIQLDGGGGVDDATVRRAADMGVSGGSQGLPFADRIQASFGRHDVSRVQAHTGPEARAANQQIGSRAFAMRDHVAFGGTPDLHTAAHEAAHVVQQRGGVQLAGGVGRSGDPYEQHADAVADKVVAGESAEGLLDAYAPSAVSSSTVGVQLKEGKDGEGESVGKQGWSKPNVKERTTRGTRIRRIPVEGLPSVIAVTRGGGKALVLASHALDTSRSVEIMLYYHGLGPGHGNGRDERRDKIAAQVEASGRNMVALLPQGTVVGGGTGLEEQFGADKAHRALDAEAFIGEALAAAFPGEAIQRGGTILAGHSAGGDAVSEALTNPDLKPADLKGVMLFEAINRTTLKGEKGISSDELARNQTFLTAQMGGELERLQGIASDKAKAAWLKANGFRYFAHYVDGGDYAKVHADAKETFGASDHREDRRKSLKVFLDTWFKDNAATLGGAASEAYKAMRDNYQVVKLVPKLGGGNHHNNVVGNHDAMRDGLNQMSGGEFISAPEGEGAEDVKYGLGLFPKDDIRAIIEGGWKDEGSYSWEPGKPFKFDNGTMQKLLEYCTTSWAPGVNASEVKAAKMGEFKKRMKGEIMEHPAWVREFNTLLAGQAAERREGRPLLNKQGSAYDAAFNRESHVAQRLVEAFLRAWHKEFTGSDTINSNLGEMYARVGFSETNEQSLIARGAVGLPNWCGPASETAVALGLMKRGLKFKGRSLSLVKTAPPAPTGNSGQDAAKAKQHQGKIARAFQKSVGHQAAHYLDKWAKHQDGSPKDPDGQKRGVSGVSPGNRDKDATYAKLETGDEIYLIHPGGPVSGHVATVIKEEIVGDWKAAQPGDLMSRVTYISGNTKGAIRKHGAYRPETFERELPHQDYNYEATAKWGNDHDNLQNLIDARRRELGMKTGGVRVRLQECFIRELKGKPGYPATINGRKSADFWWGNMMSKTALAPHFGGIQPGWTNYCAILDEERNKPKDAKLAELEAEMAQLKRDAKAADMPLTGSEMEAESARRGTKKSGRFCPLDANRIWVTSVVRASQLDTHAIEGEIKEKAGSVEDIADGAKAKDAVLDKYGLTAMPGTIEELWPGAMEYYEGRRDVDAK